MVKYKLYVKEMLDQNKELFDRFRKIHDEYAQNQEEYQEKFNIEGKEVIQVVREYENRLCGKSERGVYGKFSATLAEKFKAEVRKYFPKIDFVGVTVSTKGFDIRRIKL